MVDANCNVVVVEFIFLACIPFLMNEMSANESLIFPQQKTEVTTQLVVDVTISDVSLGS